MTLTIEMLAADTINAEFEALLDLARQVFGDMKEEYLRWRLDNQPDVSIFVAREGGALVGFKAGYAMTHRRYYSWLGGIRPEHRRKGIASRLMQAQHDWLGSSPYDIVETHVRKANPSMIELNAGFGFETTGTYLREGDKNYIMQKSITAA